MEQQLTKTALLHLEKHNNIHVLRDDLLPGGTKYVLIPHFVNSRTEQEFVYASPVYGAFQIALTLYCAEHGKQATIFCAKRNEWHEHTKLCYSHGARIVECENGYLTVVEKRARDYAAEHGAYKIPFGGHAPECVQILKERAQEVIAELKFEPQEIWCAVGSGLLLESIVAATSSAIINGVVVGRESFEYKHERVNIYRYPRPFNYATKFYAPFRSMPNYDRKAWELCNEKREKYATVLFWNVY